MVFDSTSRYAQLPTLVYETADGREITYVKRRFLPLGKTLPLLVEVTFAKGGAESGSKCQCLRHTAARLP